MKVANLESSSFQGCNNIEIKNDDLFFDFSLKKKKKKRTTCIKINCEFSI